MTASRAVSEPLRRWLLRLRERVRIAAHLQPPVVLVVAAGAEACMATLAAAARPSTDRLHLRDLFRDGRRYHLEPIPAGFRLYTDTRQLWGSGARRTSPAAIVSGELATVGSPGAPVTLVRLQARMRPIQTVAALAFPLFVILLILASPVDHPWKVLLAAGVAGLAVLTERFEAAVQAHAMMAFVRKALDDLPRADAPRLDPGRGPQVEGDPAFSQAWQRFYSEQTGGEAG